eukprot:15454119-Alexandrium_andersonii.AAC.1
MGVAARARLGRIPFLESQQPPRLQVARSAGCWVQAALISVGRPSSGLLARSLRVFAASVSLAGRSGPSRS